MTTKAEDGKWVKPEAINIELLEVGKMYLIDLGGGGQVPGEGELHVAQLTANDDYDDSDEDSDEPPFLFEDLEGTTWHPVDEVFALFPIPIGF